MNEEAQMTPDLEAMCVDLEDAAAARIRSRRKRRAGARVALLATAAVLVVSGSALGANAIGLIHLDNGVTATQVEAKHGTYRYKVEYPPNKNGARLSGEMGSTCDIREPACRKGAEIATSPGSAGEREAP